VWATADVTVAPVDLRRVRRRWISGVVGEDGDGRAGRDGDRLLRRVEHLGPAEADVRLRRRVGEGRVRRVVIHEGGDGEIAGARVGVRTGDRVDVVPAKRQRAGCRLPIAPVDIDGEVADDIEETAVGEGRHRHVVERHIRIAADGRRVVAVQIVGIADVDAAEQRQRRIVGGAGDGRDGRNKVVVGVGMAALDRETAVRADDRPGGGDAVTPIDRRGKIGRRVGESPVVEAGDVGVGWKRRALDG
jgi:hypothetical protein